MVRAKESRILAVMVSTRMVCMQVAQWSPECSAASCHVPCKLWQASHPDAGGVWEVKEPAFRMGQKLKSPRSARGDNSHEATSDTAKTQRTVVPSRYVSTGFLSTLYPFALLRIIWASGLHMKMTSEHFEVGTKLLTLRSYLLWLN
eukprot:3608787-Amphidinium_carterae.1